MCKGEKKEYLGLDECGLRGMSGELKESNPFNKVANESRVSKRAILPLWAKVLMFL